MIRFIIAQSIKNRFLVLLLTAGLIAASIWGVYHLKLDAIPDLSDAQVIIVTNYEGQNPEVIDKQVTYPLASAMLSVPKATAVRGISMFGESFVYVVFEDGTDIYWARSRVLEYLNFAKDRLPAGVQPKLGPDATGVGWVYQYVLFPGYYSPDHPKGLWHDPQADTLTDPIRDATVRERSSLQGWYESPESAPPAIRPRLVKVRAWQSPGTDPLTGSVLKSANLDLSQLRSLQDWTLRYPLTSVPGVSEVAPIGGFVKQYQVVVDPERLKAFNIPLSAVMMAIQRSNNDVGGATVELAETENMIRVRGYIRNVQDIEQIPIGAATVRERPTGMSGEGAAGGAGIGPGVAIKLGDVAHVQIGAEMRRGVGEFNGEGELAGAVIVARFGENAYQVIADVKAKLATVQDDLPPGVLIIPTYDRSELIARAIHTLRHTLIEEITVVGIVCILFLLHARSELVAVFVVPASVLVALLLMQLLNINANIMSLGGIAIAIGVVVDSAIVMVENAHKHLDREEERLHAAKLETRNSKLETQPRPRHEIILEAAQEVGPSLFFSLLIITVSFLPVFVLGGESGRLFKPLAMTKTFAMGAASILSITIIPVLMYYFITSRVLPKSWGRVPNTLITLSTMFIPAAILWLVADQVLALRPYQWWLAIGWAVLAGMLLIPQKIIHEKHSPISWILQKIYDPFFKMAMTLPGMILVFLLAGIALASTWYPVSHFGQEFMPRLDEGDLLYMPTTPPSISVTKARELLQQTDKMIMTFPEVKTVHGKIGRIDSATDPAPMSMIETVVQLNPDTTQWRQRTTHYFFSDWPAWVKYPLTHTFFPESRPINSEELRSGWTDADGTHHAGLEETVVLPSLGRDWPYPIENRLKMLATGIKSDVGVKVFGPDANLRSQLADRIADALRSVPGTVSATHEQSLGGMYLDIDIDGAQASRYGLTKGDIQDIIQTAIGGMNVTMVVDGTARYPLNVRFPSEMRDDIPRLKELLISTPRGLQIPLGQVASFNIQEGSAMVYSESAQPDERIAVGINRSERDLGGYVANAKKAVASKITLPLGYSIQWSGEFEYMEKMIPRMIAALAFTIVVIILLLYLGTRSWFRVATICLALPFSLIGACWFTWAMGFNWSLAVAIGMIALAGLDAETGLVMLLYLDNSYERFVKLGRMKTPADLWAAVHDGAVKRIRPKAMTVAAAFIGLVPLLWAQGSGADVMRRLAAPLIGGLAVSFVMELLVYPIIFYLYKRPTIHATPAVIEPPFTTETQSHREPTEVMGGKS